MKMYELLLEKIEKVSYKDFYTGQHDYNVYVNPSPQQLLGIITKLKHLRFHIYDNIFYCWLAKGDSHFGFANYMGFSKSDNNQIGGFMMFYSKHIYIDYINIGALTDHSSEDTSIDLHKINILTHNEIYIKTTKGLDIKFEG